MLLILVAQVEVLELMHEENLYMASKGFKILLRFCLIKFILKKTEYVHFFTVL